MNAPELPCHKRCAADTGCLPLSMLAPGQEGVIVDLACPGCGMQRRLADLGLLPGTRIRVLPALGGGALIVERGGCRLALGRGMGHRILVQPLPGET